MGKGPQYSDATDAIRLMRVAAWFGPACFMMLSGLWYFMLNKGWISGGVFVFLLIVNVPVTLAGIFAIHRAVGEASVLLVETMFAVGDIPPPPTYPRQDVLIVQGKYAEAADWFRDHLRIEPGDHEALLRLAHLLEMRLTGYDEAGATLSRSPQRAACRECERAAARDQRFDRSIPKAGADRPSQGRAGPLCRPLPGNAAGRRRRARAQGVEGSRPYQRIAALPQVNPDPNAVSTRMSPCFRRPAASASSRAIGIEAAVVLPYFWMLL